MTKGTIVGNDEDGYYLFSYGGNEVAICYGKGLDKYERAYYSLSFKEENRFFSNRTPGFTIIDNASVEIETANRIIHPISKTEADKRGITHPDSCSVDKNFDLSDSYGAGDGYFGVRPCPPKPGHAASGALLSPTCSGRLGKIPL